VYSVATLIPLESVVSSNVIIINKNLLARDLLKGRTYFKGSGISPKGNSPKLCIMGAFEN
jgi:hypothetical protein